MYVMRKIAPLEGGGGQEVDSEPINVFKIDEWFL